MLGRRGPRGRASTIAFVLALSACSLVPGKGPDPGPTIFREIMWENHTDAAYEMRFTEEGKFMASGLVEPCSPGGMGQPMEEPFEVVLSAPDGELSGVGMPVADWRAWQEAGDRQIVAVIEASGRVHIEFRNDAPKMDENFCP